MNTNKVQITIESIQHDISEEVMKTVYSGNYRNVNQKHLISYEEYFEDEGNPPSKNTNLIKITKDSVYINKKGVLNTQMHFEAGKTHSGKYQTPFGCFDMLIHTEQLTITTTKEAIIADIVYSLSLNQSPISRCTIQMRIE